MALAYLIITNYNKTISSIIVQFIDQYFTSLFTGTSNRYHQLGNGIFCLLLLSQSAIYFEKKGIRISHLQANIFVSFVFHLSFKLLFWGFRTRQLCDILYCKTYLTSNKEYQRCMIKIIENGSNFQLQQCMTRTVR